jgi:hypothetical protein
MVEFALRLRISPHEDVRSVGSSAVFDAGSTCVKCACKSVRTVYIKERNGWGTTGCQQVAGDNASQAHACEHFHRICTRCGYKWREEVLG